MAEKTAPDPVPSPANETHISSLVVQVKADLVTAIAERIGTMPGAEVPISSPEGKLVVCLETRALGEVTDGIDVITKMPGVLSCTLVSHHVEDTAGLDELVDMPTPETTETTA